eukprot:EG_transcript_2638
MSIPGQKWDFGFNFDLNIGRINLQKHLTQKFPNIVIEHTFAPVPESYTEACDPQFAAWAREGYDVIFGHIGHAWCLAKLAASFPNVTFFCISGSAMGPPNYANLWVRFYQNTFLAGYTAGLMTKTQKVCITAGMRAPAPVMDASGFCRGVHAANPTAEVHLLETGVIAYPLLEVWNVNQSFKLGCDVVFTQSLVIDATIQANALELMSIGFFTDARLTVGETVITSTIVDFSPMLIRAAEAVLNGTFAAESQKPDWWMGWEWGAMSYADPSFLVPPSVTARVQAQTANLSRVYCGRVCTREGCLCNASACCVTDFQLNTLVSYPDFVLEHGVMQLPGLACKAGQLATWHLATFAMSCSDCPAGTYAYNANEVSECRPCPATTYSSAGATSCTACPAGTHNDRLGQGQCAPCPAGTFAADPGSWQCNACPSGLSRPDSTQCEAPSLLWLAGLGAGIGVAFVLVGIWAWWASRKMQRLRKQYSNDRVAVECAAAIARLDLQAVAWLSEIPKPNCIQLSFIRIVQILDEVRKYIPDQLLQALAAGGDQSQEGEAEDDAKSVGTASASAEPVTLSNSHKRSLAVSSHRYASSPSMPGKEKRVSIGSSLDGQRLFLVKKVTYMLVRYDFSQHEVTAGQAEQNMVAFLGHLMDAVRTHGGTVGGVMYDHAVVHWGTGRRAVAEAPVRAVEAAMAIAAFTGPLLGGAALTLNIAIGCGNTITGVVETASNHFFVVGGGQVPLVQRMAIKNWSSILGVQILVTDTVRAAVQYSFLCHPRLVDGDDVLWEPVSRKGDRGPAEWMYQLHDSEEPSEVAAFDTLLRPFAAVRKGDYEAAEGLIGDLRQQCLGLQPTDLAALGLLASNAAARMKRSL